MVVGITGANGFIGRYVAEQLAGASEYEVLAVVRSPEGRTYFEEKNISSASCELESRQACEDLINRVDVLIHLAHSSAPMSAINDLTASAVKNLVPSLNLLEAIDNSGKPVRLVYGSSGGTVYGAGQRRPFLETDPCAPQTVYGIQKYTVENYIRHYMGAHEMNAVILRISNPYGVLLDSNRKQGLIGVALNRMRHDQVIQVYGNPENIRDYLHLDDLVRAFARAIEADLKGEIFNIGSGLGFSVNEILDKLDQYMGFEGRREYVSNPQAESLADWSVLDNSKAGDLLGWHPEIELDQGLKALCQSVKGKYP